VAAAVALLVAAPTWGASASGPWREAVAPRTWTFPGDHGAHPAYRTEWWYFTGNLTDDSGNRYGYELTFFREGIRPGPVADRADPWALRDLYLAHFTVTDVAGRRFFFDERASRTGPGLAGAAAGRLDVQILGWSARMKGDAILLRARKDGTELALELKAKKPPVLHGEGGLSRKGPLRGQASHYVSSTELATAGSLKTAGSGRWRRVAGVSWFDHEFGSNQLSADQAGWDWFGLHLSDGRDLMLYFLRRKDGTIEPASSGTVVDRTGRGRHVVQSMMGLRVLGYWKSQKTGAVYPSQWRITVPAEGLDLVVSPLLADQELVTPGSTGVTYWEGAVEGRGLSEGREATCLGYVELTGYAGQLGGLF
jgi:predicted secreted hydrolase